MIQQKDSSKEAKKEKAGFGRDIMTESIHINISYLHRGSEVGRWLWSRSHPGGRFNGLQFRSLEVQIHTIQFGLFIFLRLCMHDCLARVHHGPFDRFR